MEAQNKLGVCHVKNEGLSQHSDMATKGTRDLKDTSDTTIQADSWALDGGAFKDNRDLWGRSFEKGRRAEFGEMLNLSKSPFSFSSNYKSKSSDSSKYLKRGRPSS